MHFSSDSGRNLRIAITDVVAKTIVELEQKAQQYQGKERELKCLTEECTHQQTIT